MPARFGHSYVKRTRRHARPERWASICPRQDVVACIHPGSHGQRRHLLGNTAFNNNNVFIIQPIEFALVDKGFRDVGVVYVATLFLVSAREVPWWRSQGINRLFFQNQPDSTTTIDVARRPSQREATHDVHRQIGCRRDGWARYCSNESPTFFLTFVPILLALGP